MLLLLLLLQTSTTQITYDTRAFTQACDHFAPDNDAIVVCGRRDKTKYRIPALPPDEPYIGTAETQIGRAKVGVGTEQGNVGGFPSNRIMAKIKIPL